MYEVKDDSLYEVKGSSFYEVKGCGLYEVKGSSFYEVKGCGLTVGKTFGGYVQPFSVVLIIFPEDVIVFSEQSEHSGK